MLSLRDTIATYTSNGHQAYPIARALFDEVIAALRRDPRLRGVSTSDFELLLADARENAERRLIGELKNMVHAEVVSAALLSLEGDDQ